MGVRRPSAHVVSSAARAAIYTPVSAGGEAEENDEYEEKNADDTGRPQSLPPLRDADRHGATRDVPRDPTRSIKVTPRPRRPPPR